MAPSRPDERQVINRLLHCGDPTVMLKARRDLRGEHEETRRLRALRVWIAGSPRTRKLLSRRRPDGTIHLHPYRKWQGPHWTLVQLARSEYPAGDHGLNPLRDQVYDWLLSPEHLRAPRTVVYPEQTERIRRCASQEGNAVWYSVMLGLENDRTRYLVDRLIQFQWPDGGWNCDKRREARTSSFVETLIPLRALHAFGRAHRYGPALQAADRAAEFLLQRHLLFRRTDGTLLTQYTKIQHPIRFYGPLFALQVMAEIGKIGDPRCQEALAMLEEKRRPDGGFPAEDRTARAVDTVVTRGTFADWGPCGIRHSNDLVTVDALTVLHAARRRAPVGRSSVVQHA